MSALKDLTGQKFGRLTVIERAENDKNGRARWKCICDCGNEIIVASYNLIKTITRSCGCLSKDFPAHFVHGMHGTKIYRTWNRIKGRCLDQNNNRYRNYGGRGIMICDEWLDFRKFYNYVSKLEHFNEEGYTLDRINNDGNYCPDNVRWATAKEQAHNKRNNIIVEYNGIPMTLTEASELSK